MADFLMPRLGADMTEATLVAWKIQPGDLVFRGMVVAEVDTAKGIIYLECFQPGNVLELVSHEVELVTVGAVLARIEVAEA
ncbi:MAG: biotin/lipoyl-containing protein, partial [Planctomycetota bacterium]